MYAQLFVVLTAFIAVSQCTDSTTNGTNRPDFEALQTQMLDYNVTYLVPLHNAMKNNAALKRFADFYALGLYRIWAPCLFDNYNDIEMVIILQYCQWQFNSTKMFIDDNIMSAAKTDAVLKTRANNVKQQSDGFINTCATMQLKYLLPGLIQTTLDTAVNLPGLLEALTTAIADSVKSLG